MTHLHTRRYTKLHEQILLSRTFSFLCGWLLTVAIPATLYWGHPFWEVRDPGRWTAITLVSACLLLSYISISRTVNNYPGGQSMGLIISNVLVIYLVGAVMALLLRVELSRYMLLISTFISINWFIAEHLLTKRYLKAKIAIIPGGMANELIPLGEIDSRVLTAPNLAGVRYDAVVADFSVLDSTWQRFITQCVLNGIAVYDARAMYEAITGRVRLVRMTDNNLGALLPSRGYERFKTILDIILVVLALPVLLPVLLVTALCIRLDSPGPVFYTQTRIGRGNQPFRIYKFRSMKTEACLQQEARFAQEDDQRITRVGHVIRKLRIDELPQLLNVLKGDMAIIGPRPEQPEFVEQFDQTLPFYAYRHVIKPGITGWAQVRYGYAADENDTQAKIEHDFYYIKHASIYLDIYILLLTARTVLTGFGAR